MSRRPAYDEVDTVVVLNDNTHQNYHPNTAASAKLTPTVDAPYKSNLLSNDNVIAFAAGVVIDDGSNTGSMAGSSMNSQGVQYSRR